MDTFDDELNPSDRRREFGEMADKLSAWVQSIPLGPATGVRLVYRYADRQGHDSTLRVSVTPRVYEAGGHHDAVIGMIHALIHTAPTGWVVLPEGEGSEVRIAGFDLAIVLTGDPQASGLDDR